MGVLKVHLLFYFKSTELVQLDLQPTEQSCPYWGDGESLPLPAKNLLIPPHQENFPPVDFPKPNFYPPLNNNFQVITQ